MPLEVWGLPWFVYLRLNKLFVSLWFKYFWWKSRVGTTTSFPAFELKLNIIGSSDELQWLKWSNNLWNKLKFSFIMIYQVSFSRVQSPTCTIYHECHLKKQITIQTSRSEYYIIKNMHKQKIPLICIRIKLTQYETGSQKHEYLQI